MPVSLQQLRLQLLEQGVTLTADMSISAQDAPYNGRYFKDALSIPAIIRFFVKGILTWDQLVHISHNMICLLQFESTASLVEGLVEHKALTIDQLNELLTSNKHTISDLQTRFLPAYFEAREHLARGILTIEQIDELRSKIDTIQLDYGAGYYAVENREKDYFHKTLDRLIKNPEQAEKILSDVYASIDYHNKGLFLQLVDEILNGLLYIIKLPFFAIGWAFNKLFGSTTKLDAATTPETSPAVKSTQSIEGVHSQTSDAAVEHTTTAVRNVVSISGRRRVAEDQTQTGSDYKCTL